MTKPLFLEDAYLRDANAAVFVVTDEGGIILDATNFYAMGGGQPGDSGTLTWEAGGRQGSDMLAKFNVIT
jgi:misacylated tRNA(Ala) deacylase